MYYVIMLLLCYYVIMLLLCEAVTLCNNTDTLGKSCSDTNWKDLPSIGGIKYSHSLIREMLIVTDTAGYSTLL